MNCLKRITVLCFLLTLLVIIPSTLAYAGGSGHSGAVAVGNAGSSLIEWRPIISYKKIELSISAPDGTVTTEEFGSNQIPAFSVTQTSGKRPADGIYTYELRVTDGPELVQSGTFQIQNGSIVIAGDVLENEQPAPGPTNPDTVIADDLIVDGRACVGLTCVNGETFTDDGELKLDGNNTRLKFEDSSSSVGYPTRDWRITINDNFSGGLDRFSITDLGTSADPMTIVGGGPANSLYITNIGRVGLGTSTPSEALHLRRTNGTASATIEEASAVSATRTLLRLANKGKTRLSIKNNAAVVTWAIDNDGSFLIGDVADAPQEFSLTQGGNLTITGTLTEGSSKFIKKDITSADPEMVLAKVLKLPISEWRYIEDDRARHLGPMSEDFHESFGLGVDDTGISTLDENGVALASIQGLNARLEKGNSALERKNRALQEQLESENGALKEKVQVLEERLKALEAQVSDLLKRPPE